MVLKFLKSLFGSSEPKGAAQPPPMTGDGDIVGFVRYVVCNLVDDPKKVNVTTVESDDEIKIEVTCEKKDIGKVIGRRGRTISAVRALVTGAARRSGKRITVEVLD